MVRIEGVSRENFWCSILSNKGKIMEDEKYEVWGCYTCGETYEKKIYRCSECNMGRIRKLYSVDFTDKKINKEPLLLRGE